MQESLDDGPSEENRLMLIRRCPTMQYRSLTASPIDTALVPALCILPQEKQPKQARTHCFQKKKILFIEKIVF